MVKEAADPAGAAAPAVEIRAPDHAPAEPAIAGDTTSANDRTQAPNRVSASDSSLLVLVADPDPESAKATANATASWGLRPILAHDGVEAIMTIQRTLPRVVILDAALPKMFGFQVC